MIFEDKKIKELLLQGNYVSKEDIAQAENAAKKNRESLFESLLHEQVLTKDLLGQAVAESLAVPYADLNSFIPSKEQVERVPYETAREFRMVFFSENAKGLIIATDDPTRGDLRRIIAKLFPKEKSIIAFSLPEDIDAVFAMYYRKPLETRFSKIIQENKRIAPELIEEIISDALSYHASDIHFEPNSSGVIIRFRVDGVLQEAGTFAHEHYENILNRIKVQSRLRIDEHFGAQDGSMHYTKEGVSVDLRTSIIPTIDGEKVVLRVLAAYVQGLSLSDLGLTSRHQEILKEAAEKPFGMILVAGPTGSGKTTTLYALLKTIKNPGVNITTIEDPVEYRMAGVNQIQVNTQTNLTFAKGLRSIVRQDPDVILVGEIRDRETAEIAVNAALTGHLLFSTFHANDAATAIPRLLDMGIEPFLLASTLELIIAQRLVRKICEQCRHSTNGTPPSPLLGKKKMTLYKGKGCSSCNNTGYKGRTALYECIGMTSRVQDVILHSASAQHIWSAAQQQGARSFFDDGIEKVKNGITTFDELLRVAKPPKL